MTSPLGTAILVSQKTQVDRNPGRKPTFVDRNGKETCVHTGQAIATDAPHPWRKNDEKPPALAEEQKKAQETCARKAPVFQINEHTFVSE